jgi:hypothetical protein
MKYDPKVRTSTQVLAEKVLITMSHNGMECFQITDTQKLRNKRKTWIPWTLETLMIVLQSWDPTTSLPKLNEVFDVLTASGLIIRRDALLTHRELTTAGRAEAERLGARHPEG